MNRIKLFVLLVLSSFYTSQLTAQTDEPYENERYFYLSVGMGPRFLNTDPGIITTHYVDNSPSQDNLSSTTKVRDGYVNPGLFVAVHYGNYHGLSHSISFDLSLTEHAGATLGYSLGYSIPVKMKDNELLIRPAVNVGLGNYGFDVGDIINNDSYIQVGIDKYYDGSLSMKLVSTVTMIGPSFDIHVPISDHVNLFSEVTYNFASKNKKPELRFRGSENHTNISIQNDNPMITYNGERLNTLPYEVSGLRFSVGVSFDLYDTVTEAWDGLVN